MAQIRQNQIKLIQRSNKPGAFLRAYFFYSQSDLLFVWPWAIAVLFTSHSALGGGGRAGLGSVSRLRRLRRRLKRSLYAPTPAPPCAVSGCHPGCRPEPALSWADGAAPVMKGSHSESEKGRRRRGKEIKLRRRGGERSEVALAMQCSPPLM